MSALAWKRCLGKFYPRQQWGQRKIILLYHAVGSGPWGMSPRIFREQMQWLQEHCDISSLDHLLVANAGKKIQVAITFDDGYGCLHDIAAPILAEEKTPALVYLNTGWISETNVSRRKSRADLGHYPDESFLTWNEVQYLAKQGWSFGSHGVDHLDLTLQVQDVIQDQLMQSKCHLEAQLASPCRHFAYTWGKHSLEVRRAVVTAGYDYAVAAHHAPLTPKEDAFALPRMNIANEYSFEDFKRIVLGNWDFIGIIHRIKRPLL